MPEWELDRELKLQGEKRGSEIRHAEMDSFPLGDRRELARRGGQGKEAQRAE